MAAASAALLAPATAVGKPLNKQDAASQGDPAAVAGAAAMPDTFKFGNGHIKRDDAAKQGLACVGGEPGVEVVCYRTRKEADDVAEAKAKKGSAVARSARNRRSKAGPKARAAVSCSYSAAFKMHQDYYSKGWTFYHTGNGVWWDLTGSFDNEGSSYFSDRDGSHVASKHFGDGLGPWYPGDTGWFACEDRMDRYPFYDMTWNNRASSIFRGA